MFVTLSQASKQRYTEPIATLPDETTFPIHYVEKVVYQANVTHNSCLRRHLQTPLY